MDPNRSASLNKVIQQNSNLQASSQQRNNIKNLDKDQQNANNKKTANIEYQVVPTLKPVGYVIGQPAAIANRQILRPAELVYPHGLIVHEYPSRPVSSLSPPQKTNPNIVPHTNFIYSSAPKPPQVIYSPPKVPIVSRIIQNPPVTHPVINVHAPPPSQVVQKTTIGQDYVPRVQYQRCVQECRNWETKYNQLYLMYLKSKNENESLSLKSKSSPFSNVQNQKFIHTNLYNNSQQNQFLMKENRKLKQKLRYLQSNHQKLSANMQDVITSLINKYRDSTLKQCLLLTNRYKLEKKINEK